MPTIPPVRYDRLALPHSAGRLRHVALLEFQSAARDSNLVQDLELVPHPRPRVEAGQDSRVCVEQGLRVTAGFTQQFHAESGDAALDQSRNVRRGRLRVRVEQSVAAAYVGCQRMRFPDMVA